MTINLKHVSTTSSAHSHSSSRLVVFALQGRDPLLFISVGSDLHSWELEEALLAGRKL